MGYREEQAIAHAIVSTQFRAAQETLAYRRCKVLEDLGMGSFKVQYRNGPVIVQSDETLIVGEWAKAAYVDGSLTISATGYAGGA